MVFELGYLYGRFLCIKIILFCKPIPFVILVLADKVTRPKAVSHHATQTSKGFSEPIDGSIINALFYSQDTGEIKDGVAHLVRQFNYLFEMSHVISVLGWGSGWLPHDLYQR